MSYSIPLEFKLAERETPAADGTSGPVTKRGKIKEDQLHTNRWLSTWIPWDDQMDLTAFLRNLQRELASVGLAATRDVERNIRARIDEYKIFSGDISSAVLAEGNNNGFVKQSSLSGEASAASSGGPVSMNGSPSSSIRRSKRRRTRGGGLNDDEDDDDDLHQDQDDSEADDDDDGDDEAYSARKTNSRRGRKRKQPNYLAMARPSSSSLYSGNNNVAASSDGGSDEHADNEQQSPSGKKIKFQCATCDGPLEPGIKTCPQCGADAMPKPGSLGKGKKLCRSCKAVLASFRRECTYCHVPCGKGD